MLTWLMATMMVCVCLPASVCVLICHPCSLQAPDQTGRLKQALTLRSDLWQYLCWAISLFPYSSYQVWLKTETSDLNITPTWEKSCQLAWWTAKIWGLNKENSSFRMGILRLRKDRTEEIIETCVRRMIQSSVIMKYYTVLPFVPSQMASPLSFVTAELETHLSVWKLQWLWDQHIRHAMLVMLMLCQRWSANRWALPSCRKKCFCCLNPYLHKTYSCFSNMALGVVKFRAANYVAKLQYQFCVLPNSLQK